MKTLTNAEIANIIAYTNTDDSITKNTSRKFTIEFAWLFRKNLIKIRELYEVFIQIQQDIANSFSDDEHSVIEESSGQRIVREKYEQEYLKQMNELMSQKNEVDIQTILFSHLVPDGESTSISLPEMEVFAFMIEDDDEVREVYE